MTYSYLEITPTIRRPIIEIIIKSKDKFAIYPGLIDSGADYRYQTKVLFAQMHQFSHGVLGQLGFFDHFDVKLSHQKQIIEIEPVKVANEVSKNSTGSTFEVVGI